MAASRAHVVRQLQFAAIGAFLELGRRQRMVAAAHVPLGRRGFSLGDSHCGTFDTKIKIATICASSQRDRPTGGSWIVANRRSYSGWSRGCKAAQAVRGSGGGMQ